MEEKVRETYQEFEAIYGARKLNALGIRCSTNYVADIMANQGIKARNGKGFVYRRHSLTMLNVSENILWAISTLSPPIKNGQLILPIFG